MLPVEEYPVLANAVKELPEMVRTVERQYGQQLPLSAMLDLIYGSVIAKVALDLNRRVKALEERVEKYNP